MNDIQTELEKILADELANSISEEILLNLISPETKGLPSDDRRLSIQRNSKIDSILGTSSNDSIKFFNLTESTVDIESGILKKTLTLVKNLNKPGLVWMPWIFAD